MTDIIHPHVTPQLAEIELSRERPLIICDADEVLFQFAAHLDQYLEQRGMFLDLSGYPGGTGIRRIDDNSMMNRDEMPAFIDVFFETETELMAPVPNAAECLADLSERAQVMVLSNLPIQYRDARARSLREHGMDYPIVANIGLKGAPVRHLEKLVEGPVFFLDDTTQNIESVDEVADDVYLIHFVHDPRIKAKITAATGSHHHTDDWLSAHKFIEQHLSKHGY